MLLCKTLRISYHPSSPHRGSASPIIFSTTVPLTRTVLNPILLEVVQLSHLSGRRMPIETMERVSVYRFGTGSRLEPLDIGV